MSQSATAQENYRVVGVHTTENYGLTVTIESLIDPTQGSNKGSLAIQSLQSGAVRELALRHAAASGVPSPSCTGVAAPQPYAVDENGAIVERQPEQKVFRYRVDVPIQGRLT